MQLLALGSMVQTPKMTVKCGGGDGEGGGGDGEGEIEVVADMKYGNDRPP
jgi:hypothetical protein